MLQADCERLQQTQKLIASEKMLGPYEDWIIQSIKETAFA